MPAEREKRIAPGGVIGIIGGGQLGRMTALAAARLGYRCHIFCPEADSPAAQVSAAATVAAYEDETALAAFADAVDAVTFEFENIPAASVKLLCERTTVRPGWRALEISQDRRLEKAFLNGIGIATAPWHRVESDAELAAAIGDVGLPGLLKTARFGYDGKGQIMIRNEADAAAARAALGNAPAVFEGLVDFEREISVVLARGVDGQIAAFDAVENRHRHNILDVTTAPAPIPPSLAQEAQAIAGRIAQDLSIAGLLAVEMFVTRDHRLLVNEIAPRPHNSGHWTMDACATSQFEQFVRAVAGVPLGSPERLFDATMTNLIGDDVDQWPDLLRDPGARLHLYGKAPARPGRKMGHVNRLFPRMDGDRDKTAARP